MLTPLLMPSEAKTARRAGPGLLWRKRTEIPLMLRIHDDATQNPLDEFRPFATEPTSTPM